MESLTFCYYMPVVPVLIEDNMPLLWIEFQATSEIASEKEKQITMSFQYTSDLLRISSLRSRVILWSIPCQDMKNKTNVFIQS